MVLTLRSEVIDKIFTYVMFCRGEFLRAWVASPTHNPPPSSELGTGRSVPIIGMTPGGVTVMEVVYN